MLRKKPKMNIIQGYTSPDSTVAVYEVIGLDGNSLYRGGRLPSAQTIFKNSDKPCVLRVVALGEKTTTIDFYFKYHFDSDCDKLRQHLASKEIKSEVDFTHAQD
jgi:hypothetical protein